MMNINDLMTTLQWNYKKEKKKNPPPALWSHIEWKAFFKFLFWELYKGDWMNKAVAEEACLVVGPGAF